MGIIFVDIQDFSELGMQNIAHHFIAILATASTFIGRGIFTTGAAATCFTELSTVALHFRFYMIKFDHA